MNPVIKTLSELAYMRELIICSNLKNGTRVDDLYIEMKPRHLYMRVTSSRFNNTRTKEALVIPAFSKTYGDCYLIAPEYAIVKALNKATDKTSKKPKGLWIKKYPFMKVCVHKCSMRTYEVIIKDKWETKEEYDYVTKDLKEEMF